MVRFWIFRHSDIGPVLIGEASTLDDADRIATAASLEHGNVSVRDSLFTRLWSRVNGRYVA